MKAGESQFLPFLNGKKQFMIPIYQRTYSWTYEQCQQLWNDIVQVATDTRLEGHFIGSIVYIEKGQTLIGNIPQYLVIDGQQRLTTLSLLLVALAQVAKEDNLAAEISDKELYDSYIINTYGKGEQRYKLLLTQNDKKALIEIVDHPDHVLSGTSVVLTTMPDLLINNYRFFVERIRQSKIGLSTLYAGISKLVIVQIALGRDDNPQLIFESLNSTGMDLSQADLIRNYVLMDLDTEEQAQLYNDYWFPMERDFHYANGTDQFNRFMRDYLTVKQGSIPNIDRVYASFKAYHHSQQGTPIREVVEDIYRYACYFLKVALLKEEDEDIRDALNDINTLKVEVAYPFLLEVYGDYANHRLSKNALLTILRLVESYVFRRLMVGVPTHGLNKVFVSLAKEIDKESYLESVQAAFLAKVRSGRFPRDEEFRAAFVVRDIYNLRLRKYLLGKLEHYGTKEQVDIENCSIEHIMPQNENLSAAWREDLGPNWKELQSRYLHTIGNLTLTGYNSELGDRPFREKRDMEGGFAHSPLRLSRGLARLEHWNRDEIERRAQSLADDAVKVWTMPELSVEQVRQYNILMQQIPLELTGPLQLPQVGFIPPNFKIIRRSEKRFYLYRNIEGKWIQYGDGKRAWYAVSWQWAGGWVREKAQKNEMPIGVGGEIVENFSQESTLPGIQSDTDKDEMNGSNGYTLNSYVYLQGAIRSLFDMLRQRILKLDPTVREEYKNVQRRYSDRSSWQRGCGDQFDFG